MNCHHSPTPAQPSPGSMIAFCKISTEKVGSCSRIVTFGSKESPAPLPGQYATGKTKVEGISKHNKGILFELLFQILFLKWTL